MAWHFVEAEGAKGIVDWRMSIVEWGRGERAKRTHEGTWARRHVGKEGNAETQERRNNEARRHETDCRFPIVD